MDHTEKDLLNDAIEFVRADREARSLQKELDNLVENYSNLKSIVETSEKTLKRRKKAKEDLEVKLELKSKQLKSPRVDPKQDKSLQKTKYLSSIFNLKFGDFNKIVSYFDVKEKQRIENHIIEEKIPLSEYTKSNKSTICVKFMIWKKNEEEIMENLDVSTTSFLGERKKKSNIEIFYNTFRISKETTALNLKRNACNFWGVNYSLYTLMDANKITLKDNQLFDSDEGTKSAKYSLFKTEDKENLFMSSEEKESGVEKNELEDTTMNLKTLFNKYFYHFKNYFLIFDEEKGKRLKKEEIKHIHDYHYIFTTSLIVNLFVSIFSVYSFYSMNESSMRNGFKQIFSKYGNRTIYDINSREGLLDYIEYLATPRFREEFMIRNDFEFIGVMAVRQARTRTDRCIVENTRLKKNCYFSQYKDETKSYSPIPYRSKEKPESEYMYYASERESRIIQVAKGFFSNYDGSGYLFLLDQKDNTKLAEQADKFINLRSSYLDKSTKAVVINFNLHFKPKNVNMTAEIVH